jgi:hypothetical protein
MGMIPADLLWWHLWSGFRHSGVVGAGIPAVFLFLFFSSPGTISFFVLFLSMLILAL